MINMKKGHCAVAWPADCPSGTVVGMSFLSRKLLWKGVTDDILTPRINQPGSLVGRGKRWVRAAAHSPLCCWPSAPDLETSVWASKDTGPREKIGQDEPKRAELGQHRLPTQPVASLCI